MLSAVPWSELAVLAVALVLGGILTGVMAGTFGVGGGGVMVPILYEVFRTLGVDESVRMQLCVGTSLAIIIPTAYVSYRTHRSRGAGLSEVLKVWRWPAIAGIVTGSAVAAVVEGWVLQLVFALVVGLLGFKSVVGRNDLRISDHLPSNRTLAVYGYFLGLAASLVGISGGGISTNILLLYGVPILPAVATSAGIGIIIPIPGVIGYAIAGWPHLAELPPLSLGYVSVIGFVCMAPTSMLAAPYGARLAHRLSRRTLEVSFGAFLMIVSARFIVAVLWG